MKKPMLLIILLSLSIVLSLTACERSASKAPVPTATAKSDLPPFPTPEGENAMTIILTQTAMAKGGGTVPTQGTVILPTNTIAAPVEPTAVPPTPTSAATMIPVPSPTPGLPATWTLHQGESPYCIARRFNLAPSDLLDANNLDANAQLAEGTELKIPAGAAAWPLGSRSLMAHPDRWTVDPGDSIYSIACAYGDVDPNAIIYANGLESPYTLSVGQVLNIP